MSGHIDRVPDDIAAVIAVELSKKLVDVPLLKVDAKRSFVLQGQYAIAMPVHVLS